MSKLASLETQSQIMAAFSKIISDRQNIVSKVATKEEQAEREKRKQVLEQAATYTVDSLVKGLADLQLDFSGVITELSEKLETESAKLDAIKRGISIQSQQLEELQKIRVVADVLHLLTQEHQEKMNLLETQASQGQESLEKEMARERKLWEKDEEDWKRLRLNIKKIWLNIVSRKWRIIIIIYSASDKLKLINMRRRSVA